MTAPPTAGARVREVHAQLEKITAVLEEHQGALSDLFTKLECVREEPKPTSATADIDPPQGDKVHHRLALSIQRLSRMTRQVEEVSAELEI